MPGKLDVDYTSLVRKIFRWDIILTCNSSTVKAVVGLVRYCLEVPGVKCVLTEHLNQDPLEAFFGRQRMGCGRNDNPSVQSFLQKTVSLRVQGSAALQPFRGNCRRRRESDRQPIPVDNTPIKKRKRRKDIKS